MKTLRLLLLALLAAPMLLSACNLGPRPDDDDDDAGDDDDATDDDDAGNDPIPATIAELNDGTIEIGQMVIVEAVVTTPWHADEDDNEAMFWVQDDTGPGNGIMVFTFPDVVDQITPYQGKEVTITAEYDNPFGFGELKVNAADQVVVGDDGTIPAPYLVDAGDIQGGFADTSLYGILVEVEDLEVTSAGGWDSYMEWEAGGVLFDSLLHYADVMPGYALDSVVGVMHLDYGNAKIHPRDADDVAFEHPGCDTAESGDLQDINCGAVGEDSDVEIDGLVVVSPEPWYGNSFYVSDPDGDLYGGAVVYSFDDITIPAIGAVVDVIGEYEEYRGNTEIIVFDGADITDTGDTIDLDPIPLADACDINESYEGMLVSVASVDVLQSSDGAQYGFYEIEACQNFQIGSDFFGSDDFETATPGGAGTITELIGIVIDEWDTYSIHPRDEFDWTTWE